MEALVSGFLLDYRDWSLWEYIGRSTRAIPDMSQLSGWRTQLAKRFPAIASFHAELSAAFVKTVGYGSETHQRFEPTRHRAFIDSCVHNRLKQISALLALGITETFPGSVLARFQDWVLVEGDHNFADKRVSIGLPLAKAFPAASFSFRFEEVKP